MAFPSLSDRTGQARARRRAQMQVAAGHTGVQAGTCSCACNAGIRRRRAGWAGGRPIAFRTARPVHLCWRGVMKSVDFPQSATSSVIKTHRMRRQLPIPLSLCLAAACAWPLGARAFLGPLPPCVLRAGLALAPLPRTARGRVTAACRLPLTLRAAADADADAELTKEQKLKKYQNLAVELITKAKKLPPG